MLRGSECYLTDPPTVRECQTALDGKTLDGYIDDNENIYELKGNYKISWKKIGGSGMTMTNYTNSRTFHITGLGESFYYIPYFGMPTISKQTNERTNERINNCIVRPSELTNLSTYQQTGNHLYNQPVIEPNEQTITKILVQGGCSQIKSNMLLSC